MKRTLVHRRHLGDEPPRDAYTEVLRLDQVPRVRWQYVGDSLVVSRQCELLAAHCSLEHRVLRVRCEPGFDVYPRAVQLARLVPPGNAAINQETIKAHALSSEFLRGGRELFPSRVPA